MAVSGASIRAARAFVEMTVDDKQLRKGLDGVLSKTKSIGAGVAKVGAGLAGAGAAIVGPLIAATQHFASAGDELQKMSLRTGASVEALSELKFAAEQSGSSIQVVEKGMKGMSRTLLDAELGLSTALDALHELGLDFKELQGLNPEEQFTLMADALAKIEDPSRRTAVAMKAFGRAGTELIPLLASGKGGMAELREEARRLGLTMSTASANSAADYTDAMHEVWSQIKMVTFQVGSALGPAITDLLRRIQPTIAETISWVSENKNLVLILAKVGGGLLATGTALGAVGTSAIIAVQGVSALVLISGKLGASLAVLAGPAGWIALTAVAVVGLGITVSKLHPMFRDLNRELERSAKLSSDLSTVTERRLTKTLKEAASIGDPRERKKFLEDQMAIQKKDVEGTKRFIEKRKAQIKALEAEPTRPGVFGEGERAKRAEIESLQHDIKGAEERLKSFETALESFQDAASTADIMASAMPQQDKHRAFMDVVKDRKQEIIDTIASLKQQRQEIGQLEQAITQMQGKPLMQRAALSVLDEAKQKFKETREKLMELQTAGQAVDLKNMGQGLMQVPNIGKVPNQVGRQAATQNVVFDEDMRRVARDSLQSLQAIERNTAGNNARFG